MAASDLLLKDQSASPAAFAPESVDQGTNGVGTTIKRPMYGVPDGANVSQGTTTDAAYAGSGASTIIAILKGLYTKLGSVVLAASTAVIGKVSLQVGGVDVSASNMVPVSVGQPTSITTGQVSVTTSATLIVASRVGRKSVTIVQEGTTIVRLGASGVAISTGVPLPGTIYSQFTFDGGAAIYGIVASGTQTVSYAETY